MTLSGCWWWMDPSPPANTPSVEDRLKKCREEAREAFYDGGKSASESERIYEKCVEREGVE